MTSEVDRLYLSSASHLHPQGLSQGVGLPMACKSSNMYLNILNWHFLTGIKGQGSMGIDNEGSSL
jgi:hypothetical protein